LRLAKGAQRRVGRVLLGIVEIAVRSQHGAADQQAPFEASRVGISDTPNILNINLTNCSMFSNSNASNALSIQGINDVWTAAYIGTVGQASTSGNNDSYHPAPTQGAPAIPDPYAAQAANWPISCGGSSCMSNPSVYNASGTLSPGAYLDGILLDGTNQTYTFSPGVYYIYSSQNTQLCGNVTAALNICGQGNAVNATAGVTLVVLPGNSNSGIAATNSTFNLTAPSTGWSAGVAIWEPLSTQTNNFTANVTGLICAPNGNIQYSRNTANPTCTQIVANTITFANSTSLQGGDNCVDAPGAPTLLFGRHALLVQ
jgi:hypothetical protein